MKNALTVFLTGLLVLLSEQACQAGLIVSLSSNAPDINHIKIGDTVTFTVSLTGLNTTPPGDLLDHLSADVAFENALLGTPSAITAGPIVPDPTFPGFATTAGAGSASADYDDLFSGLGPIVANGDFFTFTVTALAAGSGKITFTDAHSDGTDSTGAPFHDNVTPGPDLPYQIDSAGQVVPEPASWLLSAMGLAGMACLRSVARRAWRPA